MLIQDLHCHYQAQKSIAGIIHYLSDRHGLRLVGEEGAFGRVRPDRIRTFPLTDVREAVSDYFVKQGKLSGAEYDVITSSYPLRLEGVENPELYLASEKAVGAFLNQESLGLCRDLKDLLDILKPKIYQPRLKRFDALCEHFRSGRLSPERFAARLREYARQERVAIAPSGFARLAGADMSVDLEDFTAELQAAEQEIRARLYVSEAERVLDDYLQRLALVERLLNISATPEDLQALRSRPEDYAAERFMDFLQGQAVEAEAAEVSELRELDAFIRQAAEFYTLADRRSLCFADNILGKMREARESLAVMITGGFHTPDIQSELRRRRVSYVTIRPNRAGLEADGTYFERLQNRRTALEKLLARSRHSLALRTLLPDSDTPNPGQQVFGDEAELCLETLAAAKEQNLSGVLAQYPHNSPVGVTVLKRFPGMQILVAKLRTQVQQVRAIVSRKPINLGQEKPLDRLQLAGLNIVFVTAPVADRLARSGRQGEAPAPIRSWFGRLRAALAAATAPWTGSMKLEPAVADPGARRTEREIMLRQMQDTPYSRLERKSPVLLFVPLFILAGCLAFFSPLAAAGLLLILQPAGLLIFDGQELWGALRSKPWKLRLANYNPLALTSNHWILAAQFFDGLLDLFGRKGSRAEHLLKLLDVGCVLIAFSELLLDLVLDQGLGTRRFAKKAGLAAKAFRTHGDISPLKNLSTAMDGLAWAENDREEQYCLYDMLHLLVFEDFRDLKQDRGQGNLYGAGDIYAYRLMKKCRVFEFSNVCSEVEQTSPWLREIASRPMQVQLNPWQRFILNRRIIQADPELHAISAGRLSGPDQALDRLLYRKYQLPIQVTQELLRMIDLDRPISAADLLGDDSRPALQALLAAGILEKTGKFGTYQLSQRFRMDIRPLHLRQQLSAALNTPVRLSEVEPWFRGGFGAWLKKRFENHRADLVLKKPGAPKVMSTVANRTRGIWKPLSIVRELLFGSIFVSFVTALAGAEDMNGPGAYTAVDIFWQGLHAGAWLLGGVAALIIVYSIWWEMTQGRSLKAKPVNESRDFLARALRETGLLEDSMQAVYGPDLAAAAQKTSYRIEPMVVSGHRIVYRIVFADSRIPPLIAKVQKDRDGLDAEVKLMRRINQQSELRGIPSPVVQLGVHAKLPSPHRFLTGDIITMQYAGEHGLNEFLRSDFNSDRDKLSAIKNSAACLMAMHGLCGMIPRDYDRIANYRLDRNLASQIIDVGIADKYIFHGLITRPGVGMKVSAAELQQLLAGSFAEAAARAGHIHPEDARAAIEEAVREFAELPDKAGSNVSCGTICQPGHEGSWEALDEQLRRVYAEMRDVYNRIPGFIKQEAGTTLGLSLRDHIPKDNMLSGPEADLAQSVMGYLTQEEFMALQKLREDIKKSPAYQKALSLGNDIEILFVRPESGKELFWHKQEYAAGHFNRAGTRIHISLPVALAQTAGTPGEADSRPSLALKIAEHELTHILEKRHDGALDAAMAEIARRDQTRTVLDADRIHNAKVPGGMQLSLTRIEDNLDPFVDLADLQTAVESHGWRSLAVKLEHLPEDLKLLWQTLPLAAWGEKSTWWDFLKLDMQEVIFTPYLMGYTQMGGKVLPSLSEAFIQIDAPEDGRLPPGAVQLVASTHYPSDALFTGVRIRPRNLLEVSRLLARGTGKIAVNKLVADGKLGPDYLSAGQLERHAYLSERQFLLNLREGLRNRTLEPEISAGLGDPAELGPLLESGIEETEQKIKQLNYQLKLPPQILDFSNPAVLAFRAALKADQTVAPAAVSQPGSAGRLDAFNRELETIFLELRDAYNRLVSRDIKGYIRLLGLTPRQEIREEELMGELEVDMANVFQGYMPLRHHPALQQLRNFIRALPEYKQACEKQGGHIGVFFLRPGGTELFWAGGEPAAAHVRHDGSQVILPLPLALYALRQAEKAGGIGLENSLVVRLARREFKRISSGTDDRGLEREVREIAKLDKPRLAGQLKNLRHVNLGPDMRLEIAEISEQKRPVNSVKVLNQDIREAGYLSLALPASEVPKDLSELLQAVNIPAAAGEKLNAWDLLRKTTDEVIFTPHMMLYSASGLRPEEDLIENELADLMRQYGQDLRPGRRVMAVETVYPSGALLTGERINFKDNWELLLSLLSLTGDSVLERLLPADRQAPDAKRYAAGRERTRLALRRHLLMELKQLVGRPQGRVARKMLHKHRAAELAGFLHPMINACEEHMARLNAGLGLRLNDFTLPEGFTRDLAALAAGRDDDSNVSCGTVNFHQALDEQLQRVYADMIVKYNQLVPDTGRDALGWYTGVRPRAKIGLDQAMTEEEADLALVSSGYVTTEDMVALQRLRQRIKAIPEFRLQRLTTKQDIEIFFSRPETGTELFWVGNDYAAGHFNRAGTRIHISLPLALADAHFYESAEPGEENGMQMQTLTEYIAWHEFLHITIKQHDPALDKTIKEISLRDRKRLKIPYPAIQTINTVNSLRVEFSPVVEYSQAVKHTRQLQSLLRDGGWKSLAVPVKYLPAEIKQALKRLPVAGEEKATFWDLLQYAHDEIVFCPLLMAYGSYGEKVTYSLKNLILNPRELYDRQIRDGLRVSLIPTLLPSDAIVTGERLQEKEAVDFLLVISNVAAEKALQRMGEMNDLDPDYVNNLDEFERVGYTMQRRMILQLIGLLETNSAADRKLIKNITSGCDLRGFIHNLRHTTLPATEWYIRAYNQKLGRQPDDYEVDEEVLTSLNRNVRGSQPAGAVSERLRNWTNRARALAGLAPLSGRDYARRAWWIENLWVAVPVASAILGVVMLASGSGTQAWDLLSGAVFQPQLQNWVRIISLGAWGGIFLGSHIGGRTSRANLARAGLAFLVIAGLHFLPLTLAGVYLAAFAVHRIININQNEPGRKALELKIERTRQRLLRTLGSV